MRVFLTIPEVGQKIKVTTRDGHEGVGVVAKIGTVPEDRSKAISFTKPVWVNHKQEPYLYIATQSGFPLTKYDIISWELTE